MQKRFDPWEQDEIISQINIIPLVDISLVLLIIFIVTVNHIITPTIKVKIPQATYTHDLSELKDINISVTQEGIIYLENKLVTVKELREKLAARHKKESDLSLILNVDKSTYFQRVVDTLDVFSDLGISRVNIRTIK